MFNKHILGNHLSNDQHIYVCSHYCRHVRRLLIGPSLYLLATTLKLCKVCSFSLANGGTFEKKTAGLQSDSTAAVVVYKAGKKASGETLFSVYSLRLACGGG